MYVCMYLCLYIYVCVCIDVPSVKPGGLVCTVRFTNRECKTKVCMYVCMYLWMCVCVCLCTYVYGFEVGLYIHPRLSRGALCARLV
jgi:hypothetical protein